MRPEAPFSDASLWPPAIRSLPMEEQARTSPLIVDALLAVPLAFAAIVATGYQFAVDDQVQYLAWAAHLRDPGALAGDPYIEAFASLRSYVWHPIAWLIPERALPAVLLTLTIASAWLAGLLSMRISRRLGGGTLGALFAAGILIVPKEQNWFGLVALADTEFTATLLGVPASLAVMLAIAAGRPIVATVIAVCVVPIHAQTAAALLAACTLWLIAAGPSRPHRLAGVGLMLLGGLAALAYRAGRAMPSDVAVQVEAIGRDLYAELIDPSAAPLASWAAAAAIIACGAIAARGLRSKAARLAGWTACSLLVPLAGVAVLAVGVREPALWTLMLGRWLMLAQLAALIAVAAWAGTKRGPALLAAALLCVWPTGEGSRVDAIAIAITLLALLWSLFPRTASDREVWLIPLVTLLGFALRLDPAGTGVRFQLAPPTRNSPHDQREGLGWLELQQWARMRTPPGSRFVTPPYRSGWRVHSHRPTTGELRDGGIFFYADPSLLLSWHERMEALGAAERLDLAWLPNRALPWPVHWPVMPRSWGHVVMGEYAARVQDPSLARDLGASFVVFETWMPLPDWGQKVFESGSYIVLAVSP